MSQSLMHEDRTNVAISKNKTFVAAGEGMDFGYKMNKDGEHLVIDIPEDHLADISPHASAADFYKLQVNKESILRRIKVGTEGTICLVGALEGLERPAVAFVRLAEGIIMPNALEVPLPTR